MTVKEIKDILDKFNEDDPVWVYEPNDENEPYQEIHSIERGPFGDITIYRV